MHQVHHTQIALNKPVKGEGMYHVHYDEIFTEQKFRGLRFSNFFF